MLRSGVKQRHRFRAALGVLLLLATMLHLGTLDDGLLLDDNAIYGGLHAVRSGHPEARWWDLYYLGGFDERLRFSGRLPWWAAQGVQLHFFRPVAAATHYVDILLWPENVVAMHVQNLAWFAATGGVVAWLYRGSLRTRAEAFLACAVFVLAYIHEWPVQWLAARNAQVAMFFGVFAIAAYQRWQLAWWWRIVAPVTLGLSLLSTELGVSVVAFVMCLEFARWRDASGGRWWRLGSAIGVVAVWRGAYVVGGYGAIGAGTYIDPLSAPIAFLRVAPQRVGMQLLALVAPPELLVHPAVPLAWRLVLGLLGSAAGLLVLRSLRDRDLWPWACAAGLCFVPLAASVPQPRLLGFALLGVAPLVARTLLESWSTGGCGRLAVAVVGLHQFLLGPLIVTGLLDRIRPTELLEIGEPGTGLGDLKGRNLFLLSSPSHASARMVGATDAVLGRLDPRGYRAPGLDLQARVPRAASRWIECTGWGSSTRSLRVRRQS